MNIRHVLLYVATILLLIAFAMTAGPAMDYEYERLDASFDESVREAMANGELERVKR